MLLLQEKHSIFKCEGLINWISTKSITKLNGLIYVQIVSTRIIVYKFAEQLIVENVMKSIICTLLHRDFLAQSHSKVITMKNQLLIMAIYMQGRQP